LSSSHLVSLELFILCSIFLSIIFIYVFVYSSFSFYFNLYKNSNSGITKSGSRLLIFDYGGTLLFKEKHDIYIKRQTLSAISGRKPTNEVMKALEELSNDPYNIVVIVTGLTKLKLGTNIKN